ncbi:MAG: hypothetical protein D6737_02685 [Chloroflexi bacterium]|nr:MAG: hypothetical protein D6737_02685 [Chloroflexota bacterium]
MPKVRSSLMFFTIEMVALYEQPALDARVVGQVAPNQSVPVDGMPVERDGWLWYRVKGPDETWIPQQRVDGTQALLEWRGLGRPPGQPEQRPVTAAQPAVPMAAVVQPTQPSAPATEAVSQPVVDTSDLRVKTVAFEITSLFEGGSYAAYQNYDRGIISYGLFQFTLAAGSLGSVVAKYLKNSTSPTAQALRAYRQRIIDRDESLREDEQFKALLKEAAQEDAMKAAQIEVATTGYWDRVQKLSVEPRGIVTPLGKAMLFDIGIQYGIYHSLLTMAEENLGVPEKSRVGDNGITEQQLIAEVAAIRKRGLYAQAERDNLPGLKPRADFWVNLIEAGDWDLQGDADGNIKVKGRDVQVRQPVILSQAQPTAPSTTATPQPTQPQMETPVSPIPVDVVEDAPAIDTTATSTEHVDEHPVPSVVDTPQPTQSDPIEAVEAQPITEVTEVPSQAPAPERVLYITPTGNRVNLRSEPSTSARIMGTVKRDELLEVVEPFEDAIGKIGVRGQWVRVRTVSGEECYTAAWLFREAQPDTMLDTETPSSEPADTQMPDTPIVSEPEPQPETLVEPQADVADTPVDVVEDAPAVETTTASTEYVDEQPVPSVVEEALVSTPDDVVADRVLYLSPKRNNIRLRATPTKGETIGGIRRNEVVESLEPYNEAQAKVGIRGQWIHVRTSAGQEGFAAAWLIEVVEAPDMPDVVGVSAPETTAPTQSTEDAQPESVTTESDMIVSPDEAIEAALEQTPAEAAPTLMLRPKGSNIRLRAAPVSGDTIGGIRRGEHVEVAEATSEASAKIGVRGQWVRVRTAAGLEGYAAAWLLEIVDESGTDASADSATHQDAGDVVQTLYLTPKGSNVRLRAAPSEGETIGGIRRGEVVTVVDSFDEASAKIGVRGQWVRVQTTSGQQGYAAAWLLQISGAPVDVDVPEDKPAAQAPVEQPSTDVVAPLVPEPDTTPAVEESQIPSPIVSDMRREDDAPPEPEIPIAETQPQFMPDVVAPPIDEPLPEPEPSPPPEMIPEPAMPAATLPEGLRVVPTTDEVNIRARPTMTARIVGTVAAGEVVAVVDVEGDAAGKIGVRDQWIQVHKASGEEGFAAAWLFEIAEPSTAVAEPPPTMETEAPQPDPVASSEPVPEAPVGEAVATGSEPVLILTPKDSNVRLRAAPVDGDPIGGIRLNETVVAAEPIDEAAAKIGVKGQWVRVRTTTGQEGFAAAWLLVIIEAPEQATTAATANPQPTTITGEVRQMLYLVPTVESLRLRAAPVNGQTIGGIKAGEVMQVTEASSTAADKIGQRGEWIKVRTASGQEGYVAGWLVRLNDDTPPDDTSAASQDAPADPAVSPSQETTPSAVPDTSPQDSSSPTLSAQASAAPSSLASPPVTSGRIPTAPPTDTPITGGQISTTPTMPGAAVAPDMPPLAETPQTSQAESTVVAQPEVERLYIRATEDSIRLREEPVSGRPVGSIKRGDVVEVIEAPANGLPKVGMQDEWIQVRTASGQEGYTAAWFFELADTPQTATAATPAPMPTSETNIVGVNLDVRHPLGTPDPSRLGKIGWVRFGYDVSHGTGSTDIGAAFDKYAPILDKYAKAGVKVMLVCTHQTFGEGQGYNWEQMDSAKWRDLSDKFADVMGRIAMQYVGQGLVHAYQIWNEQDAHSGARASVPLPADEYSYMLSKTIPAIRAVDRDVKIITGGHASGPGTGAAYANKAISAMPHGIRPDGVAFHPYGRGDLKSDPKYRHFGNIDESVNAYAAVMPGKPVWITEWGVLDAPTEPPDAIAKYATEFITRLKTVHAGKVAAAMWFAWGQGMDNGYGLVDENDQPRGAFTDEYCNL